MSSSDLFRAGVSLPRHRGAFLASLLLMLLLSACLFPGPDSTGAVRRATPTGTTVARQAPPLLPGNHPIVDRPVIHNLPPGQALPQDLVLPLTINLLYNDTALERTLTQIYTPGSPLYGQYLTPQQIRQAFGPSEDQIQSVRQWFSSQGYRILGIDSLATSLRVEASVATIEHSLHLQLQQYIYQQAAQLSQKFYLPTGQPSLPAHIASLVQSIIGLSTFGIFQPEKRFQPLVPRVTSSSGSCSKYGAKQALTRAQLATAYQFDQLYQRGLQGQGMSIGILELNEPFDPHDVATYFACAGVQSPSIEVENVVGKVAPGPGEGEAALDIELAGSLAPQAHLVIYQAQEASVQDMLAIFQRVAAENRVTVLSVSYGAPESALSDNEQLSLARALRILATEGISVLVSSGDCGAFSQRVPNLALVEMPSAIPYAISVGGTILQMNAHNVRTAEKAWGRMDGSGSICQNDWGSGGGVTQSSFFKRPSWQVGPGLNSHYDGTAGMILTPDLTPVQAPNGLRQVPDVAAAADNIAIFWNGRWVRVGGTSAAAPIWAAGLALLDQSLRQQHKPLFGSTPTTYRLANHPGSFHPFNDIVSGDNGFYRATSGWDYVTGWGSPNFFSLLQCLLSA
ncbi:S53 family peptidase [Thermogemmatispora carboxidivorans]|uniref:S53 family peptidase n=1 Tax=Thermogemmatispora carboxidivorans TaxID=1382306 RepID=UPI00069A441E|nr:S53 family peptidase [Thermogemmatispora carboxidivorans]